MRYIATFIFIFSSFCANAQKEGNVWCFPKNCKIDWSDSLNPLLGTCILDYPATLTCSSICDQIGNLKFYGGGTKFINEGGKICNEFDSLILNGDSIKCYPYSGNGALFLPLNIQDTLYYFISITRTLIPNMNNPYLFFSTINHSFDSVTSKNINIDTNAVNEKLAVTRHANGRDWWVLVSTHLVSSYKVYLIDQNGVQLHHTQIIGDSTDLVNGGGMVFGQLIFSEDGSLLAAGGIARQLYIYDFDRCTGLLSNFRNGGENTFDGSYSYFGIAISPDNTKLYGASAVGEKKLWQFDLTASNINATKTLIKEVLDTGIAQYYPYGLMKIGPDGKIYITKGSYLANVNSTTGYNTYLDAIANPNGLGLSCNYIEDALYLGGQFSISGLPNIPNYKLGPVIGSVCDSLGLGEKEILKERYLNVYPNPSTGIFNFELKQKTDAIKEIAVYNSMGKKIFIGTSPQIDLSKVKAGLYYYRSITLNGRIYKGKLQKF